MSHFLPFLIFSIYLSLSLQAQTGFGEALQIEFTGNLQFSETELEKLTKTRLDNKINKVLLKQDCKTIQDYYHERGFLEAVCDYQILSDENRVETKIKFAIFEGLLYTFGKIEFKDTRTVSTSFMKQISGITENNPFSKKAIISAQSNLMRTGLFDDVFIRHGQPEESGNKINVIIEVSERKRNFTDFGTGYDSEDSWRNFIGWGIRNLDGQGKQVMATGLYAVDYKNKLYFKKGEISLKYFDYLFFWPRVRHSAGVRYVSDKPKSVNFGYKKTGLSTGLTFEKSSTSSYYLQIIYENIDHFSVDLLLDQKSFQNLIGEASRTGIQLGYQLDKRNDYVDPTAGMVFDASLLYNPEYLGEVQSYLQNSYRAGVYKLLFSRAVIAIQTRFGAQWRSNSKQDLPPYLRFYLGGSNSLRGFKQSNVGAKNEDGSAAGGHFLLLNNLELRYYLSYKFNFVLLFDTGNLWLDSRMIKLAALNKSLGFGIRYRSRFGLFRLDYANPINSQKSGRFHIGFGQAF